MVGGGESQALSSAFCPDTLTGLSSTFSSTVFSGALAVTGGEMGMVKGVAVAHMCRVDLRDQPAVASDRFNVVQLDTSERETRQAQAWQEEEEIMSSSQESSASACLEPYAGELLPIPEYGCAKECVCAQSHSDHLSLLSFCGLQM